MRKILGALALAPLLVFSAGAQNIDNPVISGIADCGVMRWAGKYYIGGVATYGDFLVSDDLVHWDSKVHAFDLDNGWTHGTGAKNNQIHANDMTYIGGKFHLLFSVNYWGSDKHIVHITHAESDTPEGPYREARDDHWFENRIDPMAFQDEDGKVYLYMVKFTDGNVIWGRPMNERFEFTGEAREMFTSRPHSWERMDNKVIEGPFVVKRHGAYYMMYNTNHTGISYGNYRLGAAQADSPLGFNEGNKYPWPVVGPDETYMTPGQPNIVRGPNGWEWWLVYMANKRGEGPRSQFIDRIHFVDGRLTVDGITGKDTPGVHPLPAKPFYEGKEMVALPDNGAYLFEATFADNSPRFGIKAWESGKSKVEVGINRETGKGFITSRLGRKTITSEVDLPYSVDATRPHLWRVENNFGTISVWVDGILLCDHQTFSLGAEGHPSLLRDGFETEYITYTPGWDEWEGNISGWSGLDADGMLLPGSAFKGDAAEAYEFSALLRSEGGGLFGVYAAYSDEDNLCRLSLDPEKKEAIVESIRAGKASSERMSLGRMVDIYPDPKYSDAWEKQYHFPEGEVCLDGLELPVAEFEGDGAINDDPASLFQISYLSNGKWVPLEYSLVEGDDPAWQRISFGEIRTQALSFINRDPKDSARHISGIRASVTWHDPWQVRVLRDGGMIHIHLDNRLIYSGPAPSTPSKIGLFSESPASARLKDCLYFTR